MIRKFKYWLLRKAINYIVKNNQDSRYVTFAKQEFDIVYKDWRKSKMQSLMCNQVIELLSLLATQGDSGFSISYKCNLLTKLIRFEPLGKLTFEDNEFGPAYTSDGTRQNLRDSRVFLNDNTITFLEGIIKREAYYIGEELVINKRNGGTWSGGMFVLTDDNSIYKISSSTIIRNKDKFTGKSFTVPIYAIEYPKDWWISIVRERDLKDVIKEYDLNLIDCNIEKEINYKEGIYKDEILKRIELVKNHKQK